MSNENMNSERRFPVALVGVVAALVLTLFALCTCVVFGGAAFLTLGPGRGVTVNPPELPFEPQQDPVTRPTVVIPTFTPTPSAIRS